jgi:hypothetical protein
VSQSDLSGIQRASGRTGGTSDYGKSGHLLLGVLPQTGGIAGLMIQHKQETAKQAVIAAAVDASCSITGNIKPRLQPIDKV